MRKSLFALLSLIFFTSTLARVPTFPTPEPLTPGSPVSFILTGDYVLYELSGGFALHDTLLISITSTSGGALAATGATAEAALLTPDHQVPPNTSRAYIREDGLSGPLFIAVSGTPGADVLLQAVSAAPLPPGTATTARTGDRLLVPVCAAAAPPTITLSAGTLCADPLGSPLGLCVGDLSVPGHYVLTVQEDATVEYGARELKVAETSSLGLMEQRIVVPQMAMCNDGFIIDNPSEAPVAAAAAVPSLIALHHGTTSPVTAIPSPAGPAPGQAPYAASPAVSQVLPAGSAAVAAAPPGRPLVVPGTLRRNFETRVVAGAGAVVLGENGNLQTLSANSDNIYTFIWRIDDRVVSESGIRSASVSVSAPTPFTHGVMCIAADVAALPVDHTDALAAVSTASEARKCVSLAPVGAGVGATALLSASVTTLGVGAVYAPLDYVADGAPTVSAWCMPSISASYSAYTYIDVDAEAGDVDTDGLATRDLNNPYSMLLRFDAPPHSTATALAAVGALSRRTVSTDSQTCFYVSQTLPAPGPEAALAHACTATGERQLSVITTDDVTLDPSLPLYITVTSAPNYITCATVWDPSTITLEDGEVAEVDLCVAAPCPANTPSTRSILFSERPESGIGRRRALSAHIASTQTCTQRVQVHVSMGETSGIVDSAVSDPLQAPNIKGDDAASALLSILPGADCPAGTVARLRVASMPYVNSVSAHAVENIDIVTTDGDAVAWRFVARDIRTEVLGFTISNVDTDVRLVRHLLEEGRSLGAFVTGGTLSTDFERDATFWRSVYTTFPSIDGTYFINLGKRSHSTVSLRMERAARVHAGDLATIGGPADATGLPDHVAVRLVQVPSAAQSARYIHFQVDRISSGCTVEYGTVNFTTPGYGMLPTTSECDLRPAPAPGAYPAHTPAPQTEAFWLCTRLTCESDSSAYADVVVSLPLPVSAHQPLQLAHVTGGTTLTFTVPVGYGDLYVGLRPSTTNGRYTPEAEAAAAAAAATIHGVTSTDLDGGAPGVAPAVMDTTPGLPALVVPEETIALADVVPGDHISVGIALREFTDGKDVIAEYGDMEVFVSSGAATPHPLNEGADILTADDGIITSPATASTIVASACRGTATLTTSHIYADPQTARLAGAAEPASVQVGAQAVSLSDLPSARLYIDVIEGEAHIVSLAAAHIPTPPAAAPPAVRRSGTHVTIEVPAAHAPFSVPVLYYAAFAVPEKSEWNTQTVCGAIGGGERISEWVSASAAYAGVVSLEGDMGIGKYRVAVVVAATPIPHYTASSHASVYDLSELIELSESLPTWAIVLISIFGLILVAIGAWIIAVFVNRARREQYEVVQDDEAGSVSEDAE